MKHLPIYIEVVFVLTALFTLFALYKAGPVSKKVLFFGVIWMLVQSVAAMNGFYLATDGLPPRFVLILLPAFLLIAILFNTPMGKAYIDSLDLGTLTWLHVVRIPVELVLYWLCLHKMVPEMMTFEGMNFDIVSGITAPLVYYAGFVQRRLSRTIILWWNIGCLLLLTNIVVIAFLSFPFVFQQFSFSQPNVAILYFPFIWLPGCVVPIVLFAHLVSIRRLTRSQQGLG